MSNKKQKGLLVLSRRVGERVMIGDNISIVVTGIQGNQVKIGFSVPREISVHREEIYNSIQEDSNLNPMV